ncbi:MAG: hypothetical protein V7K55_01220 [Nostoc sp.]|uniref:hypothetical protein n=1 Tax=Nostoc sp. TaxID=1180 RepID=UPI002FF82CD6
MGDQIDYTLELSHTKLHDGSRFELIPKHIYYNAIFDVPTSELQIWINAIREILTSEPLAEDEDIISIPNKREREMHKFIYIPSKDKTFYTVKVYSSFHCCWKIFKEYQAYKNHDFYIKSILEGIKLRKESTEDIVDSELEDLEPIFMPEIYPFLMEGYIDPSLYWEERYLTFLEKTNQKLDFEFLTYKEIKAEEAAKEEEARMSYLDEFIASDEYNDFGYSHISYEQYIQEYD